jgi:hypothetical protein
MPTRVKAMESIIESKDAFILRLIGRNAKLRRALKHCKNSDHAHVKGNCEVVNEALKVSED